MEKRAIRTPEGAREIIEYNINVLYHLPKQYTCLAKVLKGTRRDLLKLLNFCRDTEPKVYKQKYTWFMWNDKLTDLRGTTTRAVSNRRFNYWSSIGVIIKIEQAPWKDMTELNKRFVGQNFGKRPINTFTVYKYTPEMLGKMEERASALLEHKVTGGNISHDKLLGCGLDRLAKEVFPLNSKKPFKDKIRDFNVMTEKQEDLIDEKGYTTKAELCEALGWKRSDLDKILNTHGEVWREIYNYKAPNKCDVERYGVKTKSWIITRR